MSRNKFSGLKILLFVLLIVGAVTFTYRMLIDTNKLTVVEKNYINSHKSNLIDVRVLNDTNLFARGGKGVFYDYLEDIENEYGLKFNKIAITNPADASGLSLTKSSTKGNGKVLYIDHYVLVAKKYVDIPNDSDITGVIGVLGSDLDKVNKYFNKTMQYKSYENKAGLLEGLSKEEVSYIAVPSIEYADVILENLYSIVFHMSNLKDFYYLNFGNDEILNSIMTKYLNRWEDDFRESLYDNEYQLFTNKLKISEKELDVINSKTYSYGFVPNPPYEVKSSGNYGGINGMYLDEFSKFSGITFDYKNFKTVDKLRKEIGKGNIDLYMDSNSIGSLVSIDSPERVQISVVLNNSDSRVYSNLESLKGETVYVANGSPLATELQKYGIIVANYKDKKEAKKVLSKNEIVAMSYPEYLIYRRSDNSSSERFREQTSVSYYFRSNNDTMFNKMFTYFISFMDPESIIYTGVADYDKAVSSGRLITRITEYTAVIVIVIGLSTFVIYKYSKKVHLKKRIKKTDKMKYIDMLTSLKNRNFLNEQIPIWNRNTIYPQAIVLINLNGIQGLNDALGYTEGDKQIQSFANILIKTQLDNSEIMRTDGNEFIVYLLGYSEKQVLSYIKKLNKEIKDLPYNRGAAIGFSMILDDVKLIDDAINEATEAMKKNKNLAMGEEDEEKL